MANEIVKLGVYHDDKAVAHPIEWEVLSESKYVSHNDKTGVSKKFSHKIICSRHPIGFVKGQAIIDFFNSEKGKSDPYGGFIKSINDRYVPLTLDFGEQIKIMEEKLAFSNRTKVPKRECKDYFFLASGYIVSRMDTIPFGSFETDEGLECLPVISDANGYRLMVIKHSVGNEDNNEKQEKKIYYLSSEKDIEEIKDMTFCFHVCTKIIDSEEE